MMYFDYLGSSESLCTLYNLCCCLDKYTSYITSNDNTLPYHLYTYLGLTIHKFVTKHSTFLIYRDCRHWANYNSLVDVVCRLPFSYRVSDSQWYYFNPYLNKMRKILRGGKFCQFPNIFFINKSDPSMQPDSRVKMSPLKPGKTFLALIKNIFISTQTKV